MKALVYKQTQKLAIEDRPKPSIIQADDVIVKIISTGICGTDRNIYLGRFKARENVILGHESVGIIEEIGNKVTKFTKGDRVIINPTLHCGRCDRCRRGEINLCENKSGKEIGVDRDGTFAQFAILPEEFIFKIPNGMSFDQAVFVEPLACVLNNANAANLSPSDDVAIMGAGPIGMIWALFAKKVASEVLMIEKDPFRINFAKKKIKKVVDANAENVIEAAIKINRGRKPRIVVETTGVMLEQGLELVDKGGKVVVMGFNSKYKASVNPQYLVNNAISIIGAGDYNSHIFPKAIDIASKIYLEDLITQKFPLEAYDEAFSLLSVPSSVKRNQEYYQAMKVLIVPGKSEI